MFLECIKELIRIDKDWVPKFKDTSLYVRPTYIGTEVRYRGGGGCQCPILDHGQICVCSPIPVFSTLHSISQFHSPLFLYILHLIPYSLSFSHSHVPILPSPIPHFPFPIPHFPSPILLFLYFPFFCVSFSCLHLHLCHFAIILQFSIPALYRCPCL